MNDAFEKKLRAAAVAGWWVVLVVLALLLIQYLASLLSGYMSNNDNCLWLGVFSFASPSAFNTVKSWFFSKSVMLRICRISLKLRSSASSFFKIATRTYTLIEIHTCVRTAFGEVP